MRSLLVEFHRFNDLDSGSWRAGDKYLIAAAAHRVREVDMTLGQDDFLDLVFNLRYQSSADDRAQALKQVGEIATRFLGTDSMSDMSTGTFPLQLDLVVNPAELAALPFEAATDDQGLPLFARDREPVVLTRRVRHEFADEGLNWPAQPRILFAWAEPPGVSEVPHEEHASALRAALEPWIDPDDKDESAEKRVLQIVPNVTLAMLEEICRTAAASNDRFTHVHLLAHGYPVGLRQKQRFGVALQDEHGDLAEVTPEQLESALAPLVNQTVVVTLATCDAANLTNTTTSQRSIAHNLHVTGFPIVLASQLPLTKVGSNLMVAEFYKRLLAGDDVRTALHSTRMALYGSRQETGHDWASLVGYARLPEGYSEHLANVRLESVMAALKTIQRRCDRMIAAKECNAARFDPCIAQLQARIDQLAGFIDQSMLDGRDRAVQENHGLLGSAEKRMAELCRVRSDLGDAEEWRSKMRDAMQKSRDWYLKGAEQNLSHHWTAVQYLSLDAVLTGRISNTDLWHAAMAAAEIDRRTPKARPSDLIWPLGSLLELYLLAEVAGEPSRAGEAKAIWLTMRQKVAAMERPDPFLLESTERQLRRYIQWWTTANGFFPGRSDLSAAATGVLDNG